MARIVAAAMSAAVLSACAPDLEASGPRGPIPNTWDRAAREVAIPGVDFALDKRVILIDAHHAWAYVDACPETYPLKESCRSALGVTADGGKTWERVTMPGRTSEMEYNTGLDDSPRWLPLNATTVSLVTRDEIHLTRDQGDTWSRYPLSEPPLETQLAANLGDNFGTRLGDHAYACPDTGMLERPDENCEFTLIRLGTGPVSPRPPFPGRPAIVQQGGDGRIWLTRTTGENEMRTSVSADGGKSWKDLPPTTIGSLQLSPDGSRAIISHHITQWRLDGERWVKFPGMYGHRQMGSAVVRDDGQIAGVLEQKAVYLSADNRITEIAGMPAVDIVTQLADGAVVFHTWVDSDIQYVGTGQGWYTLIA
ncbi:hypothetical protein FXF51_00990 [Nonomuraea sp. PA05]|uniref:hypothetical protein n=1 Tax=Nonomuraea sp. PA05 TaxID=2604466 RepID=UPI0011D56580|nr:hypothetical protein [Nonomuraea sp. PA05]TYB71047.1 hypothetical protein FXF51_00990 [Nonomuraea sp. PA05]